MQTEQRADPQTHPYEAWRRPETRAAWIHGAVMALSALHDPVTAGEVFAGLRKTLCDVTQEWVRDLPEGQAAEAQAALADILARIGAGVRAEY